MIGTTLTHYRITAKLGEGGMGEVYRARDTKLGRDVAIKVLPASFSRDAQSLGRFEREAKALAALNHPHIAGIYGFDADRGTHFLVLELVEGKTLAERLRRGPLPLEEALKVARQVAEAIQEAHEKGIIHRDLKPGNVKITPNGRVKVLDFGLAKMEQTFRGEPEASSDPEAPTIQAVTTRPGAVMGTPAYMSPEQARGQELDKRTDIWAFGCCLFECLSGRKPFQGQTASDLMAEVLKSDPDWAQIPSETPREVVSLLRRCLEKDASRRLSSIGDIAITLEETARLPAIPSRPRPPEPGASTMWLRPVAAGLLIFAIGAGVFFWMRKGPTDQRPDRLSIPNTIGPSSGSSPQPNFAKIESLAVLPFENSSRDANKDYFAEALTEELSGELGQIRSLKTVKSRGTVLGYKGAKKSISEIARDLGVDAVVAGSAGLEDSRVTVSVRLIEAGSNRQRWSQTYQRDLAEVDHLESEMALAIAKEIQTDLPPGEQKKLTEGRRVNPEALAEYQRGQFYHRKSTDAYNLKAIEKLTNAVYLDKEFAAAWAALAMAYVDRVYQFAPREHEQWEEKAALAVRRALEINPDEADAYAARGLMNWTPWSRFRHEEAVEDLQHAVSLNPNSFVAHDWLDNIYSHTGLLEEALAENRINRSLDPSASDTYLNGASDWLWHGEYEKALEIWPKASLDSWPLFGGSHYAWTLFALGKTNEAAAKLDEFGQLDRTKHPGAEDDTGELAGMRALLLAAGGDVAGAETQIKSALGKQSGYGEFHHTAYFIAAAYARLNKRTEAVKWLKTTVDTGFPCYVLFRDDPNLDNLRRPPLPAFQTFLSEQEKMWRQRRKAWTKVE